MAGVSNERYKLTKLEVARRQLGTALWLYLEDVDPISVHTLAGAASELAEHLARDEGASPFIEHALSSNPELSPRKYYALARQFYNAFKHVKSKTGERREDEALLADFNDYHNDALLFIAWTDFISASPSAPIEAQVFQAWFYASHPEKMARREDADRFLSAFPKLSVLKRADRKIALKRQIEIARQNSVVMSDARTDPRQLVLAH